MPQLEKKPAIQIINPPLLLKGEFLDDPAFAFLGARALQGYLVQKGLSIQLIDSFLLAPPRFDKHREELALGPGTLGPVMDALNPKAELTIVAFPSFHRSKTLLPPLIEELLNTLAGQSVILADCALSGCLYIDYDRKELLGLRPELVGLFQREAEVKLARYLRLPTTDNKSVILDLDWESLPLEEYLEFLNGCARLNILKEPSPKRRVLFPYLSSRGCNFSCSFCTRESGRKWAGQSIQAIESDLDHLASRGVEELVFLDAYANYQPDRFTNILNSLKSRRLNARFVNGLGLANLKLRHLPLLAELCPHLTVSVESGDPHHLKTHIGKPLNLTHVRSLFQEARRLGLPMAAHYLLGHPKEGLEAANRTLDWAFQSFQDYGVQPRLQFYVPCEQLRQSQVAPHNIYALFGAKPSEAQRSIEATALIRLRDNFNLKLEAVEDAKLIMNLTYRCQNHCRFCSVGDRARVDGSLEIQLAAMKDAALRGIRLLDLDGGEPTLYPHLFQVLEAARELGFERITVTTNGRRLADRTFAHKLTGVIDSLLISIHGATADIQDRLTASPGSYEQTMQGLRNALEVAPDLSVNITLLQENLPHLDSLLSELVALGVKSVTLQGYTPFGKRLGGLAPDESAYREVLPNLLDRFKALLRLQVINIPACMLPGYENLLLVDHQKAVREMLFVDGTKVNLAEYLSCRRKKRPICDNCVHALLCNGFWSFAGNEEQPEMVDVITGYRCNCGCTYCAIDESERYKTSTTEEILACITYARKDGGPSKVRFSGGEPTIRKDIIHLVREARKLGYQVINIQSNGFRLAYPQFLERLLQAGLNKINISAPDFRPGPWSRLTRIDKAPQWVEQTLKNIAQWQGRLILEMDLLLHRGNLEVLVEMVEHFRQQGCRRFNIWYISPEGRALNLVEALVPSYKEALPAVEKLLAAKESLDLEHLMFYYFTPCLLKGHEALAWNPAAEKALVVTPDASFRLENSLLEMGVYVDHCEACAWRFRCAGFQKVHLEAFGMAELDGITQPKAPAADIGTPPDGKG